MEGI
jgi:hypothetical protein